MRIFKFSLFVIAVISALYLITLGLPRIVFSGVFDKHVSLKETIENFNSHKNEIMSFADLLLLNKPSNREVSISVHNDKVSISVGLSSWAVYEKFPNQHYDFKISSLKGDESFLKQLRWDISRLKTIVASFKETNCEYASTDGDVVSILFRSGTWSSFSYFVYSQDMPDSTIKNYQKSGITVLNSRVRIGQSSAL